MMHKLPQQLPPYDYLMQIINHHPSSSATYIEAWRSRDDKDKLVIAKKEIRKKFLISPSKFRNDLLNIAKEGLINVHESWDLDETEWWRLEIEFVRFDDEECYD